MMDEKTIGAYDNEAAAFACEWEEEQSAPDDLRAAVRDYFSKGVTVDVGCGSGRDTAWLVRQGFKAHGVDASQGLITEAKRRHPEVEFWQDALPQLPTLEKRRYTNVLCETVIMHLPLEAIAPTVRTLAQLLAPSGTMYLTWRVTHNAHQRDDHGRLYSAFDSDLVRAELKEFDWLLDQQSTSASSHKRIHRIVVRRRRCG